jgi:hypothetical protein
MESYGPEHDQEKWNLVSEKDLLKQKAGAGRRFEENSSRSKIPAGRVARR